MDLRSPTSALILIFIPLLLFSFRGQIRRLNGLREKVSLYPLPRSLLLIVGLLLTFCALGVSRPYMGSARSAIEVHAREVVILFDISKSMWADDVPPTRFEASRHAALDVVKTLSDPSFSIGLVAFSGTPFTLAPLSSDKSSIRKILQELPTLVQPEEGSSLNSAISQAVRLLAGSKKSTIILISDGEDSTFVEDFAVNQLIESGVTVYSVPIGTHAGSSIREPNGSLLRDDQNNVVISKVNKEILATLADRTGGKLLLPSEILAKLRLTDAPLEAAQHIAVSYNEVSHILLLVAALLFTLMISSTKFSSILPTIVFASALSITRISLADNYSSYKDYMKGNYNDATAGFAKSLADDPSDLNVLQALGSSQFKSKDFKAAEESFRKLADSATDQRQKFDGYYNLGNSLLAQDRFDDAIKAYDESLKLVDQELRAKTNREIALKRKEEQSNTSSDKNRDSKNQDGDNQKESSNKSESEPKTDEDSKSSQNNSSESDSKPNESDHPEEPAAQPPTPEAKNAPISPTPDPAEGTPEEAALRSLDSLPDSAPIVPKRNPQSRAGFAQRW